LQEPFSAEDLYTRTQVIEVPELYCCLDQWWNKTMRVLSNELTGPPNELLAIHLLRWNERSATLQESRHTLSRGRLQAHVTRELGEPLQSVDSLDPAAARRFMESLVQFVSAGEN
jgi:hypothetical protein